MPRFSDLLYGQIDLPDWIDPFLRIPEFVRLRSVRLSNIDSIQFKDLSNATRWEHGIAVAFLAGRCCDQRGTSSKQRTEVMLAALLHDVATPPFAHTAEYVVDGLDHELESQIVLGAYSSPNSPSGTAVFGSSLPRFQAEVIALGKDAGLKADPDEVARLVVGDGDLGFLIAGSLDLDNADNVTRGCALMGINVDRTVPLRIADWLSTQSTAPGDLTNTSNEAVQSWLTYRAKYYGAFYTQTDDEQGREAFLQHIMRRALDTGLPRNVLVWSTDETLLSRISLLTDGRGDDFRTSLAELVERYKLLEAPRKIFEVDIDEEETLRSLRQPHARTWVERHLSSPQYEPFVAITERRFGESHEAGLFPAARGVIRVFKLGGDVQHEHLPGWLKELIPSHLGGSALKRAVTNAVRKEIPKWLVTRPWLAMNQSRRTDLLTNLKASGDWSFRLSRNESLHAYPSTFVHAIPSSLINGLGLRGELVIDPFGGTGQTVAEVIKYEGAGVSADSNTIATLVAKARLTPLNSEELKWLKSITVAQLTDSPEAEPPEFEARGKWHHGETLRELCKIWSFIGDTRNEKLRNFLTACFSATIPGTTARRGKQHGFFADNTPLPANLNRPPYVDAIADFHAKLQRNLGILLRFYGLLERNGRDPQVELSRACVMQLDATRAKPADYGVKAHSVAGIITSPPYLCMADYSLGQRLSYYWVAPGALGCDFEREIGARRSRSNPQLAIASYFEGIEAFASSASALLRNGGFLATVLAKPLAKAFRSRRILERIDGTFRDAGFEAFWSQMRPIHWHRNHGYQRLLEERVAVHIKR